MKKILFVTAFPPNDQTAGQNYTKNLIYNLGKSNHKVDIIYFSYEDHKPHNFENENISYIKKIKSTPPIKIYNSIKIFLMFPFFSTRFSFKLLYYIYKYSGNYDFIYLDFSQTFLYGLFIPKIKKYLMAHDIIIQKYKRSSKNRFLNLWVKYSENFILKQENAEILCFSNKDLLIINSEYKINGKKVDFFIEERLKEKEINFIEDYYCFYGAWSRIENLESLMWFERNISDKLKYQIKIIGSGLKENYKETLIKKGFEILGFVEDPYEVLANSRGLIAPLFKGAGVKVKVIEALACGTPVIGTDVALEGIELENRLIRKIDTFQEVTDALGDLKKINIKDKIELKELFYKEYGKNSFIKIIEEIK